MKKEITLDTRRIEYTFRSYRRSKNIRLIIHTDGRFVVSAPSRASERMIEKLIRTKSDWIIRTIDKKSLSQTLLPRLSQAEIAKYKKQAAILVKVRLEHFNRIYNFSYQRITIRSAKTRWGSCSRKGNLNFNYKLALLPAHLADYIIVHELCHLKELNHSKNFWNLVAKTVPDYAISRKLLKAEKLF